MIPDKLSDEDMIYECDTCAFWAYKEMCPDDGMCEWCSDGRMRKVGDKVCESEGDNK